MSITDKAKNAALSVVITQALDYLEKDPETNIPKVMGLVDKLTPSDWYVAQRKAFRESLPKTTKLIIAQRISSVQDCDRIIVLDQGRINGIGNHEELLRSNTIYREVFESQQRKAVEENA